MDRLQVRMKKEIDILTKEPSPGISCWCCEDKSDELEASIDGSEGTPFEHGSFKKHPLKCSRYPFEPPLIKFITRIYHPNIDNAGRICLDLLKMPPKGSWKPSLNISTLLKSIQVLMMHPNPDDPLMVDIAKEFRSDKSTFIKKAREWTEKYAMSDCIKKDKNSTKRHSETVDMSHGAPAVKQRILDEEDVT